jgi:hypothetical protein
MEKKSTHTFSVFIKHLAILLLFLVNYQFTQAASFKVVNISLNKGSSFVCSSNTNTSNVSIQVSQSVSTSLVQSNCIQVVSSHLLPQAQNIHMLGRGNFKLSNQITYFN